MFLLCKVFVKNCAVNKLTSRFRKQKLAPGDVNVLLTSMNLRQKNSRQVFGKNRTVNKLTSRFQG
jgi:hypothetical protein